MAHVVARDRSGRIVAGWSDTAPPDEPPLDPGEPVDTAASASFTVADLATVEVYVEPTGGAS
jgi:hypothetical protein